MSKKRVRLFLTTCDKYIHALESAAYLINKYWAPRPQVVVCGFAAPQFELPDNFEFYSAGNESDYPFNRWTNAVNKFVRDMPDDVFVLMLEDMWITRGVDGRTIQILADYMRQFNYVARIDLTMDRLYAHGMRDYSAVAHIDLIKSMPGSPYHLSLMAGMWNREHWLSVIKDDWSPHDVELTGTIELSHRDDLLVLGTRQRPIRHTLAFRAQDNKTLLLDEINAADVEAMREKGYLSHWES